MPRAAPGSAVFAIPQSRSSEQSGLRPLHIGLITPSFAGVTGSGSGIGVYFRHLADGLIEAGHTVTTVVPVGDSNPFRSDSPHLVIARAGNSLVTRIAGRFHWQLHQWLSERALQLAARTTAQGIVGVDIWEVTSTGTPALKLLPIAGRAPVVTRVSTTASQLRVTNGGAQSWIGRRHEHQELQAILGSDAVITHSLGHRREIAAEFGLDPARIPVIPLGIPIPDLLTHDSSDTLRILFVGRLEHRKGIDLLLAALPPFLARAPEAVVTLVGLDAGGKWQEFWKSSAPAALQSRVIFAGQVDDAALAQHFRAADLFVAPSRYESFGLMFAEAMAYGLPVVALRAPGAIDLIRDGETGLLVTPGDQGALVAALSRLAEDPELRLRVGQAARAEAIRHYSREAMVSASTLLYRSILSGQPLLMHPP